jgi:hypothetical protein
LELTPQQQRFFETFGYLHLPGLLADDIDWIIEEFEAVFPQRGVVHDFTRRSCIVPFIDQRERLCTLLDHPHIEGLIAGLLGKDFNYVGGDGNYYVGDTGWHPDGAHRVGKYIKVALYLDPVTRDTGCLRVIPGTHRLGDGPDWNAREAGRSMELWGIAMNEVPAIALESQPGDVVAFNHNLMHASFGGSTRRRMFTLNCGSHANTHEEMEELKTYIPQHCLTWGKHAHSETMRDTAGPGRRVHLDQVIAVEGLLAGAAK